LGVLVHIENAKLFENNAKHAPPPHADSGKQPTGRSRCSGCLATLNDGFHLFPKLGRGHGFGAFGKSFTTNPFLQPQGRGSKPRCRLEQANAKSLPYDIGLAEVGPFDFPVNLGVQFISILGNVFIHVILTSFWHRPTAIWLEPNELGRNHAEDF
jgi:hypothetical protein